MEQTTSSKGNPAMLRTAIVATVLLAIVLLSPRAAVAAIPEPPPYPWEYCPDGAVAFIPYATHSGPVLTVEELPPGW
jgi:hypothetical protein